MASSRLPFFISVWFLCFIFSFTAAWAPPPPSKKHWHSSLPTAAAVVMIYSWTIFTGIAYAAPNIEKGQVIFNNNCAACHVGGQNLVNPPRTLQKDAIEKNLKSLEPSTIQDFVQNSRVHRGAFILGSKLSNKDFENVVSYVVDQASNEKWVSE